MREVNLGDAACNKITGEFQRDNVQCVVCAPGYNVYDDGVNCQSERTVRCLYVPLITYALCSPNM